MKLVIPGPPVPKARPKFAVRHGFGQAYDSQSKLMKSERLKLLVAFNCLNLDSDVIEALYSLPLHLDIEFHLPIADSSSMPQKNAKLWGFETHKPDLDNLVKFMDIANGILWRDDSQIAILTAKKMYSENPCTIIEIKYIKIPMDTETKKITALFSPDEMETFWYDLQTVSHAICEMRSAIAEDKLLFMPEVAKKIMNFSTNYVPKLKKLVKKDGK